MKKVPLIGIMVSNEKDLKPILQTYERYKGRLSVRLFSFTPQNIHWKKRTIRGLCLENKMWRYRIFHFPDAVYNRCYQKGTQIIQRLETYLGPNKCFNRVTQIDKWKIYQELRNSDLEQYVPETSVYHPDRFRELLQEEKPFILKPCYGFHGKKVYMVEKTEHHLFKIYEDTFTPLYASYNANGFFQEIAQLVANKKFVIQRMINFARVDDSVVDFRILVQKEATGCWKVTKGVSRVAPYNFYITNRSENIHDIDEVLEALSRPSSDKKSLYQKISLLSIRIAQLLDERIGLLGEIGLDLAIDEDGEIWIIEVNGKPQKSIYWKLNRGLRGGIDAVFKFPLEYAYYLSQT
ncbi:YheC/YheD family protein [Paenibacillus sp. N4]|uniref:YheC/YheD family endospore coat-associated protein n=1 Tax=Paenibacillus vietnamensis TaxID=2590547 RepID=UPI001CD11F7C|nr:YheC/YheD family protein [Paenibacillus vietnamensis]MCA0755766.1 YheC/YheD family protein [Paenibacillus vietnamensis]